MALSGSTLIDGVYRISAKWKSRYTLDGVETDEDWEGTVFGLRIPPDFLELCGEIQGYLESPAGKPGAYTSETVVGLHSWSKASGKNGAPVDWRDVFSGRLAPFVKMFKGIAI